MEESLRIDRNELTQISHDRVDTGRLREEKPEIHEDFSEPVSFRRLTIHNKEE